MAKNFETKAKTKLNINSTDSINEILFVDILRLNIDYTDGVRVTGFGTVSYNDGTKDIKVDNVNIDINESDLSSVLGNSLNDLENVVEKLALNQIAGKLKIATTDLKKGSAKKIK